MASFYEKTFRETVVSTETEHIIPTSKGQISRLIKPLYSLAYIAVLALLATSCTKANDIQCGDDSTPCDEIIIEDIINP